MNHRGKSAPPWAGGQFRQAIGSPRVKAQAVHPLPAGSIVLSPTQSTHEAAIHRRSVCLTACHSIFPSPSLTGWTAIHLGVYQCRCFLGSADASRKLTRPDGCGVEMQKPLTTAPGSGSHCWDRSMSKRLQFVDHYDNAGNCTRKKGPTQVAGPNHFQQGEQPQ